MPKTQSAAKASMQNREGNEASAPIAPAPVAAILAAEEESSVLGTAPEQLSEQSRGQFPPKTLESSRSAGAATRLLPPNSSGSQRQPIWSRSNSSTSSWRTPRRRAESNFRISERRSRGSCQQIQTSWQRLFASNRSPRVSNAPA